MSFNVAEFTVQKVELKGPLTNTKNQTQFVVRELLGSDGQTYVEYENDSTKFQEQKYFAGDQLKIGFKIVGKGKYTKNQIEGIVTHTPGDTVPLTPQAATALPWNQPIANSTQAPTHVSSATFIKPTPAAAPAATLAPASSQTLLPSVYMSHKDVSITVQALAKSLIETGQYNKTTERGTFFETKQFENHLRLALESLNKLIAETLEAQTQKQTDKS
jgi:hypothetical protein